MSDAQVNEIIAAVLSELRNWKLFRYALDNLSETDEDELHSMLREVIEGVFSD